MHSAKISDQKITKISKHRNGYAGDYGQGRANGSGPGNPTFPGDPFHSPLSQGSFAEPSDNLRGAFPKGPHNTFSQDSKISTGPCPRGSFA